MERLTQRIDYNYEYEYGSIGIACDDEQYLGKVYNKLGRLEDLEEELGIDLITLFKAINSKSIFTKYDGKISEHIEDNYNERDWYMQDEIVYFYWENGSHCCLELSNYGKTWALTKEELEND